MNLFDNDLDCIYEERHFLVVNKQANLSTQGDHSLSSQVLLHVKKEKKSPYVFPVHRLDKPVSGLVLFAKSSKALARFNEQMRLHKIEKEYETIVEGRWNLDKKGRLDHYLEKREYYTKVHDKKQNEAKLSSLIYEVIDHDQKTTRLKIILLTGRYHQIRSQLSHVGYPIIGDEKYGAKIKKERIYLHHKTMRFYHPINNELLTYSSKTPF